MERLLNWELANTASLNARLDALRVNNEKGTAYLRERGVSFKDTLTWDSPSVRERPRATPIAASTAATAYARACEDVSRDNMLIGLSAALNATSLLLLLV